MDSLPILFYGTSHRIAEYRGSSITRNKNVQPTYKCKNQEDKHTVINDTWNGSGMLEKPIGLLTADEVIYAGGRFVETTNNTYYLYTGAYYRLISPFSSSSSNTYALSLNASGYLVHSTVNRAGGLLPVISLISEVTVENTGDGSYTNPYVIEG